MLKFGHVSDVSSVEMVEENMVRKNGVLRKLAIFKQNRHIILNFVEKLASSCVPFSENMRISGNDAVF